MDNKNAYGAEKVLPREMFERSELVKLTEYGDGIVAFDIDAPCGFSSDPGDVPAALHLRQQRRMDRSTRTGVGTPAR